jgi:hypothetical protein
MDCVRGKYISYITQSFDRESLLSEHDCQDCFVVVITHVTCLSIDVRSPTSIAHKAQSS